MSRYAAPSLSTGNFVACVVGSDLEAVQSAFENPGAMRVHNVDGLYPDQIYSGFSGIRSIRVTGDGITVTIYKEGNHAE